MADTALAAKANSVPVLVVRTTDTTVLQLSRVPCVGEVIYIGQGDKSNADTHWRVLSVQHIPPVNGKTWCEAVAEVHVLKVEDFDPWRGEHPSQKAR